VEKIRLGKTNLMVTRSAFGALPVQRLSKEAGAALLYRAYENGINLFDTANGYTDSEEKIGMALSTVRKDVFIATKTAMATPDVFWKNLELSLVRMKTDYIDIYQYHNPSKLPDEAMRACMEKAKEQGMIHHIGVSAHRLDVAINEAESGFYETVQYPLSALSSEQEIEFVKRCETMDIGILAMKAMAGGLLTSAALSMAFLRSYTHVVPIWGFQRDSELDEVLALEQNVPALDTAMLERIEADRVQLSGDFCRGCGYCQPCPAEIQIEICARMPLMLRRAPVPSFTTDTWKAEMKKISNCVECGSCKTRCPYELDTPRLLKEALADYQGFIA